MTVRIFGSCARLFACLILALDTSATLAQNTAQGSVTVDGKKIDFLHAYASIAPSRGTGKPENFLILSDKPLSAKAVASETERSVVAAKERISLVELKFDGNKTLVSTYIDVPPVKGNVISPSLKLVFDTFTDQRLKGRFYSEREERAFGAAYAVDVRFEATIAAFAAPEVLGQKAWQTEQGKILADYFRAARAGDKSAIKRLVTPETVAAMDGPKGADVLQFMKRVAEDPNKAQIERLVVDGDVARITMVHRSDAGIVAPEHDFKRIGGVWLIDP